MSSCKFCSGSSIGGSEGMRVSCSMEMSSGYQGKPSQFPFPGTAYKIGTANAPILNSLPLEKPFRLDPLPLEKPFLLKKFDRY